MMDTIMHSSLVVASSRDMAQSLISPRASSPLTPPATGEAKGTRGHASDEERQGEPVRSTTAAAIHAPSASPPYHPQYPIRDSPRNPFLAGGAADSGLSGPRKWQARQRMACVPPREYGKMTYVFRGQRVTYADPYASEEDEEEDGDFVVRRDEHGYALPMRTMDRMQPCLLFPHASTSSASKAPRPTKPAPSTHHSKRPALAPRQERQSSQRALEAKRDELYKRPRPDLSTENRSLLERLDRAGWRSDGEEDYDEGDIAASRKLSQHRQQCDSDDDDADDEHGEEADANPFLDSAPQRPVAASAEGQRPISNLPSRAWHQPQQMQMQQRFAQQPRGHAHALANSMHVPEHLKCRRY